MKRLFLLPFLLVYLLSVTGMPVYAHYCGGDLESWELFPSDDESDGCADDGCAPEQTGMEEEGCCQDKVIASAPVSEQVLRDIKITFADFVADAADVPEFRFFWPDIPSPAQRILNPVLKANAPPGRWQNQPLYRLFVRFTLYG